MDAGIDRLHRAGAIEHEIVDLDSIHVGQHLAVFLVARRRDGLRLVGRPIAARTMGASAPRSADRRHASLKHARNKEAADKGNPLSTRTRHSQSGEPRQADRPCFHEYVETNGD